MYAYILIPLLILFVLYLIMKKYYLAQLNRLVKEKQTTELRTFIDKSSTKLLVGKYLKDLYLAKSYVIDGDFDILKDHLRTMFEKDYEELRNTQYLTLYFHLFVLRNDVAFVNELLARIEQEKDISFGKYCRWTCQVLFDKETGLTEEMDEAIGNKEFSGFPLAVVVYLIAYQYEMLEDIDLSYQWYSNANDLLLKTDLYKSIVVEKTAKMKTLYDERHPKVDDEE